MEKMFFLLFLTPESKRIQPESTSLGLKFDFFYSCAIELCLAILLGNQSILNQSQKESKIQFLYNFSSILKIFKTLKPEGCNLVSTKPRLKSEFCSTRLFIFCPWAEIFMRKEQKSAVKNESCVDKKKNVWTSPVQAALLGLPRIYKNIKYAQMHYSSYCICAQAAFFREIIGIMRQGYH